MSKGILRLIEGNVVLYNSSNMRVRTYYSGGNATRVDWEDPIKESVQVQLKDGKIILVNQGCQIYKIFN